MSRPEPNILPRLPFTIAFLAVMVAANTASGTLSGHLDPDVLNARGIGSVALQDGNLWRFTTAIFLSHDLPMLLRQLVFSATVIGLTERLFGSLLAAGLFFALDFATTVTLLAAIAWIPSLAALAETTDVGMSLGGFGLIGLLAAHWRYGMAAIATILALVAIKYAVAPEPLADAGHVIALVIGASVGYLAKGSALLLRSEFTTTPEKTGDADQQGGRQ